MTKRKLPKINRRRAAGSGSGYSHDNGCVAFGDPLEQIGQRETGKMFEKYYRDLYPKEKKAKCRKNILRKNEML
jgi:hypothetical protein